MWLRGQRTIRVIAYISEMNFKLEYLYRDGGNYKNWGEAILSNPLQRSLEEVDALIKAMLIDSEFFYAEDWGLPDLHFTEYPWDGEIDHDWHQFYGLTEVDGRTNGDLEDFLSRPHPLHAEWNRLWNLG